MPRNDKKSVLLRQWELLKQLPSKGTGKTASELTKALNDAGYNISLRQVERDLNDLMEVFALDKDDRDIQFGWKWLHGASVDLPAMTISEALSLHMVESAIKALMPISILEGLETRFRQANKQLNANGKENRIAAKWASKVRSVSPTMPLVPPVINSEMLATVHEALLSDVKIDVDYQAMRDEKFKPIRLSPLALVNRGAVSYLIATAYEYEEVRLYAMHRIRKATKTTDAIKRPAKFDLDEYIQAGNLHFGKGEPIRLSAWVLSKNLEKILEETPLSQDQKLTVTDHKVKLTATVADTDQLTWWLLSQASNIEVTAPVALRKKIGGLLAEAAGLYLNQSA